MFFLWFRCFKSQEKNLNIFWNCFDWWKWIWKKWPFYTLKMRPKQGHFSHFEGTKMPKLKFWDHFYTPPKPPNLEKWFLAILQFFDILASFLECKKAIFFKSISTNQKFTLDKKDKFSRLLKHLSTFPKPSVIAHFPTRQILSLSLV